MNAILRAISGPLQGAIFRLGEEEVTIGRHTSNHLCIGDPSVSRRHCVIRPEDGGFKLHDLESENGTSVNGTSIGDNSLQSGDHIGIGNTLLVFLLEQPDAVQNLPAGVEDTQMISGSTIKIQREDIIRPKKDSKAQPDERRSRDLAVLAKIGKLLTFSTEVEQVKREMLELIAEIVPAERGAILAVSPGNNGAFGWSRLKGACPHIAVSRSIVDQVFKDGQSVLSNNLSVKASGRGGEARLPRQATSALAAPLTIHGCIQGVIYLETVDPVRQFGKEDLEFVTAISSYVALAVDHSNRLERLQNENRRLREEFKIKHEMIGQSARMREAYQRISRIAPTDATVLLRGETGTGKELAARAIHQNSPRAARPFEAINCALLNETLLESELFGHEKGAFTGAVAQKRGKLEIADGGTVFLDEVGELREGPQSMLLRVLQERTFERLGGMRKIQVDVRVITATNRDLEVAIREKAFREDLYYRLNVVSLSLPALRERRDDIPLLAYHFLGRACEKHKRLVQNISREAAAHLQVYDWPGNVRELENAIEHAVVFGTTEEILPEDLPEKVLMKREGEPGASVTNYHVAVRDARKQIVMNALRQTNGNYTQAAKLLSIHPNNLHRLIRELNLKAPTAVSS